MSGHTLFDWKEMPERFRDLAPQAKIVALARLADGMTVFARDTYEPGTLGVSDPKRLRGINEGLHRVTSRLVDLCSGGPDDWNEAVFWETLLEFSEEAGYFDELRTAASIAAGGAQT